MLLRQPTSQHSRKEFLEQFIAAANQPDQSSLVPSSLSTEVETLRTAYEEAIETRTIDLSKRIRLVRERNEETRILKLMIRQTLDYLNIMIRRGVYPPTILRAFNIPMVGYSPPTRHSLQIPTAEDLIRGDIKLGEQRLPRLVSPRVPEIEAAIGRVRSKTEQLTAIREALRQSRERVLELEREIKTRFYQGQRAIELNTATQTEAQRRELKRNFGYRWVPIKRAGVAETPEDGGNQEG